LKAVILAGGLGTRLVEETSLLPKPMIEIGGMPIIWHIMKIYSAHGVNDFIICCGYKGYIIKEYFANYFLHQSDVTVNIRDNQIQVHQNHAEPWIVTLVDTGDDSKTGGRLKRVTKHVENEAAICFTYGDGVGDIDISALIKFHGAHGRMATVTATRPQGRYGAINFGANDTVDYFQEKPEGDGSWINGGFFVIDPSVIHRIEGDQTSWEGEVLVGLAKDNELCAYRHQGFWQPMDTLREKNLLCEQWDKGTAPWKIWD
jgi:glucose-1-phosphate cytidylyltransferase